MLILNPTLRKYRTKPKKQGYLQKALLQVGKVKVNFDIDDMPNNHGQKENAVDEKVTGNDVEMLEIQQVNGKNKNETVPNDSPEKDFVESNHNNDNETRQGCIIVPIEDSLEKRESSCPGKVKNDLEKVPLLYYSEKSNNKNNLEVANSAEEINLNTDNSSKAPPLEQKSGELSDSRESINSSAAPKGTISELNHSVETNVVNYDDTTL